LLVLKIIRKTLKALTGDVAAGEIAAGVVLGALLGLLPFNIFNLLVLLLVVAVFRVNVGMFLLSAAAFSGLAYLAGPLLHFVGKLLLVDATFLRSAWEYAASLPLLPLTGFNNTLTMGAFAVWLVIAFPLFKGVKFGVEAFRARLAERIRKGRVGLFLRIAGWLGILGRVGGA